MSSGPRRPGNAGAHWSRLAPRKLTLSDEAEIVRQEHRGQIWYVVRDRLGDRYYRFGPGTYLFLNLLDGARTVEEAYQIACNRLKEDSPSETEVIKLLWRLHAADLLRGDTVGRTEELVSRAEQMDRRKWLMQLRSPLAIRFALFDPSRALNMLGWAARAVFSRFGFALWLVAIVFGLGEIAIHWSELSSNFSDRILAYDNLVLMWLVFPIVKVFHEFGHGLALRRWGCQSHEMGIMFLVFMPVPYIDASSSAVMTKPSQRAAVGAAGLYVELFIAALAALAWSHLEPGLVRAVLFNVMIIAGASAVLFNGNPLLKFDAYYVLSDLLEMPNLAQRSSQWWLALIQHRILGMDDAEDPTEAPDETVWLALYAPASLTYRMFLMAAIAIFVAKQAFFLGTILAAMAVFNIIVWPLWRGVRFLAVSPRLKNGRTRSVGRASIGLGVLAFVLFAVPVPYRTMSQGVVWYQNGTELRPAAGGAVIEFVSSSGDAVAKNTTILRMSDPETEAELVSLVARLAALSAQYRREQASDRGQSRLTAEEIAYIRQRVAVTQERLDNLVLTSPVSGRLVIPRERDLENGWIGRGMPIGHVIGDDRMIVLAVLPQAEMELVSQHLQSVSVRFSSDLSESYHGRVQRLNPQATDALPAELLSTQGGGPFSLRQALPGETGGRLVAKVFVLEVSFEGEHRPLFGERAFVLFDHGSAPLSIQLGRNLRQLFLREFEV